MGSKDEKRRRVRLRFGPFRIDVDTDAGDEEEQGDGCPDLFDWLTRGLPKESRKHLHSARVEALKAVRAALDARIERMEARAGEDGGERVRKVPIDDA